MKRRIVEGTLAVIATLAIAGVLLWLSKTAFAHPFVVMGAQYQFLAPAFLAAASVVPVLAWIAMHSLADLPRWQGVLGVITRSGLVLALAIALARPAKTDESARVSCAFLIDVSDSITDGALADAYERVTEAWRSRGENDVQVITFADRARAVSPPHSVTTQSATAESGEDASEGPIDIRDARSGVGGTDTDLEGALQLAYGLFPPGHLRRAVLLSDGHQTRGDALAEASRAARFRVPVSFFSPQTNAPQEIAIREVELPDRVQVGEPFRVRVKVFSTQPSKARVRLYQGDVINGLHGIEDIEVSGGEHELEFDSVVRVAGPVTYRAELEPESPDRFDANNRVEASMVVPGRPAVLYVEGTEGRGRYLAQALGAAEYEVDVRGPRSIPSSVEELQRYDFFILSDVPAEGVSMSQQEAIERYVRDLGGGFLMAGGDRSFGLGGWQGTRLERMLPVRMDSERRRDQPSLGLALVIDKSGSMNGPKMELAKEAAKATAELLGSDDYIEVIGFDSAPQAIVRMQSARNRVRILRDIGRLQARGGTNIFPALDLAYQDLAVTRARVKHVILLTDGQSPEEGIAELTQVMRAEGITVSTVGLGADVNRGFLQNLANLGGGRAYLTSDPHNIPRIFMRETTTVARSSAVEELFAPVVSQRADFLRGIDLGSAPYLRGYVATQAKPSPAQVILRSDLGEPILARQHHGLGWTLAWTSDVKNRWAVDWLRWRSFSQFWGQLVREHMRSRRRELLPMHVEMSGDMARVVVDAIDDNDEFINDLESTVSVRGGRAPASSDDGSERRRSDVETAENVPLRQVAPGRYEARVPVTGYGSFVLEAQHFRRGQPVAESKAQLSHPYPREYAPSGDGEALLEQIAAASGGTRDPSLRGLFDPGDETIVNYEELWSWWLFLALGLFVIDLTLRRVRFGRL